MKLEYPENQEWIAKQESLEAAGMPKRASEKLTEYKISNLRGIAIRAEREGSRIDGKTGKKLLAKAVWYHERANELQEYLDERRVS